jgi:rod shape-determining protein MreC
MNRARLSRANRRIVMVLVVGVVVLLLGLVGQLGPVRWLYDHTLVPMGQGLAGVGSTSGEALANLGRVKDLARDNAQLERENADLRQRLAADAETRRDNELLRKQLGLEVARASRQVAAEVTAFQPDSYRQFITINKGTKAGLAVGMAVVSEGVLVGTIAEAYETTARIMLVTDPEFKLTAKDQDTGATGIVRGQLGSGLLLDKIGQTDTVRPGDTVTTDGLSGIVPPGLYIGQVESVDTRANVVFQSAQVATSLKASRLRFVYVVLGL